MRDHGPASTGAQRGQAARVTIRPASSDDTDTITELHRRCFPVGWEKTFWASSISERNHLILVALIGDGFDNDTAAEIQGFILVRRAADEAEILSIAVDPSARLRTIATALLGAAERELTARTRRLFLEVSIDNAPALALYERAGFIPVGRRSGYYQSVGDVATDAIVMTKDIATAP